MAKIVTLYTQYAQSKQNAFNKESWFLDRAVVYSGSDDYLHMMCEELLKELHPAGEECESENLTYDEYADSWPGDPEEVLCCYLRGDVRLAAVELPSLGETAQQQVVQVRSSLYDGKKLKRLPGNINICSPASIKSALDAFVG